MPSDPTLPQPDPDPQDPYPAPPGSDPEVPGESDVQPEPDLTDVTLGEPSIGRRLPGQKRSLVPNDQ